VYAPLFIPAALEEGDKGESKRGEASFGWEERAKISIMLYPTIVAVV